MRLSLVIPTLNEAKNIDALIEALERVLSGVTHEIIVVDDGSADGTREKVRALASRFPVILVERSGDRDLSRAVCAGFARAQGEILGVMDADMSHPPEVLARLLEAMTTTQAEVVVASRLVPGGGTEDWPSSRKLSSYTGTLLARPLTPVKDPLSGCFMVTADLVRKAPLKPRGYKILLEILVKGECHRVQEVPFTFRDRTSGLSKLGLGVKWQYLLQLLDLYRFAFTNRAGRGTPHGSSRT